MDAKFFEMDSKMETLRGRSGAFPAKILKDYQDRLDVSWIFHDNALEGVVLSYSELKAAIDQRIISDVTLIPMYEEVRNQKTAWRSKSTPGLIVLKKPAAQIAPRLPR